MQLSCLLHRCRWLPLGIEPYRYFLWELWRLLVLREYSVKLDQRALLMAVRRWLTGRSFMLVLNLLLDAFISSWSLMKTGSVSQKWFLMGEWQVLLWDYPLVLVGLSISVFQVARWVYYRCSGMVMSCAVLASLLLMMMCSSFLGEDFGDSFFGVNRISVKLWIGVLCSS